MAYEILGKGALNYQPCRYGSSKILFRGPKKKLMSPYIAVLGGTETYGKFVEHPYPELLQHETGIQTVNLGCPNAGVDAFLHDHGVKDICNEAAFTVLQVPGAHNLSNRFYAVHPRRNDRFLRASKTLKSLYGEVDFTEFSFTRHLLTALHDISSDRFERVIEELQTAWTARMKLLVETIDCRIVLLWMSDRPISGGGATGIGGADPLFVTQGMVHDLAPFVHEVVEVSINEEERANGWDELVFADMDRPASREMLGVVAHRKASNALSNLIRPSM